MILEAPQRRLITPSRRIVTPSRPRRAVTNTNSGIIVRDGKLQTVGGFLHTGTSGDDDCCCEPTDDCWVEALDCKSSLGTGQWFHLVSCHASDRDKVIFDDTGITIGLPFYYAFDAVTCYYVKKGNPISNTPTGTRITDQHTINFKDGCHCLPDLRIFYPVYSCCTGELLGYVNVTAFETWQSENDTEFTHGFFNTFCISVDTSVIFFDIPPDQQFIIEPYTPISDCGTEDCCCCGILCGCGPGDVIVVATLTWDVHWIPGVPLDCPCPEFISGSMEVLATFHAPADPIGISFDNDSDGGIGLNGTGPPFFHFSVTCDFRQNGGIPYVRDLCYVHTPSGCVSQHADRGGPTPWTSFGPTDANICHGVFDSFGGCGDSIGAGSSGTWSLEITGCHPA